MASTPAFLATPRESFVTISTANTARDGTGTMGTLITGAASGTLITRIIVIAAGTTTAGVVRLFKSNDTGSTKQLREEIIVPAITPSTTVAVWSGRFRMATLSEPILLVGTTDILYVSTNNAESFNAFCQGGDL